MNRRNITKCLMAAPLAALIPGASWAETQKVVPRELATLSKIKVRFTTASSDICYSRRDYIHRPDIFRYAVNRLISQAMIKSPAAGYFVRFENISREEIEGLIRQNGSWGFEFITNIKNPWAPSENTFLILPPPL